MSAESLLCCVSTEMHSIPDEFPPIDCFKEVRPAGGLDVEHCGLPGPLLRDMILNQHPVTRVEHGQAD